MKKFFSFIICGFVLWLAFGWGASAIPARSQSEQPGSAGDDAPNALSQPAAAGYLKNMLRLTTTTSDEVNPFVVYNPHDNRYLLAWSYCYHTQVQICNVYGLFTDLTGQPIGARLDISLNYNDRLMGLAYNSSYNEYMVAFLRENSGDKDLYGRIILGTGTLYGSEIAIEVGSMNLSPGAVTFNPNVTNDGHPGEYLVAYSAYNSGVAKWMIALRRVGSWGNVDASSHLFSTGGNQSFLAPDVAYNPTRNEYLLVFRSETTTAPTKSYIVATRLNAQLESFTPGVLTSIDVNSTDGFQPHVAIGDGEYLITWTDGQISNTLDTWDIHGRSVSGEGAPYGSSGFEISKGAANHRCQESRVAYQPGYGFLVTWEQLTDFAINSTDLYGRYVKTQPNFVSDAFPIDTTSYAQNTGGLACSGLMGCLAAGENASYTFGGTTELTAWQFGPSWSFLPLVIR